ncbi:hypothetical protein [Paenibacillus pini]|uniref:Uncharacterized protein n=1 Tax=Paenibacillus pini JCM 16418 TaxID=1236976 RepID=W7Z199_9BACL|nr:hypothetical protein [Paenibacillus pini]GAF10766.1 hypothetical protein JCM16418_4986 [Paenibacillus pini JCM 16418]
MLSFKKRSLVGLLLVMSLLLTPSWITRNVAHAKDDPNISLKTEAGYNGKIEESRWNPLKVTLTSDRDVSGDLVFQSSRNSGSSPSSYVQHVELPKDTPKEVILGIPGGSFNQNNNQILFFENSVEKGRNIPFSSGTPYLTGFSTMSTLIGVLSEDPDAMNFMNVLSSSGFDVATVPLTAASIPEDPMLLDGIGILVVDRFASDTLSKTQIEAIKGWVKSGGALVLAGGASYSKTASAFGDLSPMEYNNTYQVTSLPELAKLGGKKLELGGAITLSDGTPVKGAEVVLKSGGKPIFVKLPQEKGTVLYAAYDVSMEPIASWSGHPSVWSSLLRDHLNLKNSQYAFANGLKYNLGYILDYFPSLKMPSFQMLIWLLIIYAIVVAPLLYFILKRVDKREWAWWMIPLIAIVASGAVYMIGSADKTKELAHTINIMEMDGKGIASTTSATAFFTPRSGKFELEFPGQTYMSIQNNGGSFSSGDDSKSFITVGAKQTKVMLLDTPQWSLVKMWPEQRLTRKTGQFNVELMLDDQGNLDGKVTNETVSNLTQVTLVIGGKVYELGDMERNTSMQLSKITNPQLLRMNNLGNVLYPYPSNNQKDPSPREREILNNYVSNSSWYSKGSYVIGWSKDKLLHYTIKGKEITSDQLNLWAQPITVTWNNNGVMTIPFGFIVPVISQVNSGGYSENPNGIIDMSPGSVTLDYNIPSMNENDISHVNLRSSNLGKKMTYQIWNNDKQAYEPMKWEAKIWTATGSIKPYLTNGGIRIMISTKNQTQFVLPEISVKGKGKQP